MNRIRDLIEDIRTPEVGGPYKSIVIAIGHAVLGAFLLTAVNPFINKELTSFIIPSAYFLLKEVPDLRNRGNPIDSVVDTFMVWLGTYYGSMWWPAAVLVSAFASIFINRR